MQSNEKILLSAAAFAAKKHTEQRRKDVDASPYINHPIQVAALLADEGGVTDVVVLVAALLHDTVEDTHTSLDEIAGIFGPEVSGVVSEVTDDKSLEKQRRKQLQVENAPKKSDRAKQLKIADKICNIRDIDADSPAGWDFDRKDTYLRWANDVVNGCRNVNDALDQLFDEAIEHAEQRLNASKA